MDVPATAAGVVTAVQLGIKVGDRVSGRADQVVTVAAAGWRACARRCAGPLRRLRLLPRPPRWRRPARPRWLPPALPPSTKPASPPPRQPVGAPSPRAGRRPSR